MNYCTEKEIITEGRLVLLLRGLRSSVTTNRDVIGEIQNSINKIKPLDPRPEESSLIYGEPNGMLDELSILIDELNYSNKILERNLDNLKSIV